MYLASLQCSVDHYKVPIKDILNEVWELNSLFKQKFLEERPGNFKDNIQSKGGRL